MEEQEAGDASLGLKEVCVLHRVRVQVRCAMKKLICLLEMFSFTLPTTGLWTGISYYLKSQIALAEACAAHIKHMFGFLELFCFVLFCFDLFVLYIHSEMEE